MSQINIFVHFFFTSSTAFFSSLWSVFNLENIFRKSRHNSNPLTSFLVVFSHSKYRIFNSEYPLWSGIFGDMGVSGLVPCLLTSSWNLEYFVKDYHIDAHIVQAIILLWFNAKNNEVYLDFLMFEIVGYYIIKPFTCGNLPKPMFLFSLCLTHLVIITCIVLFVSPHPLPIPTGWRCGEVIQGEI